MSTPFAFNPLDPGVRRDPYALYARARAEHPALLHAGLPLRVISVFGYDDVQATLRDDERFSNDMTPSAQLRAAFGEEARFRPPCWVATATCTRACAAW